MSRTRKAVLIVLPLFVLGFYNNCGNVQFSPAATPQNNSSAAGVVTPTNGAVVLSPYVNAVAYEDLYYPPGATSTSPDFDYNDFLTEFQIQERANSQNQLTDIYIDFYPRAVGAGYDHEFFLVLTGEKTTPSANLSILPKTKPMFNGAATVTLSYYDENGNQIGASTNPPYNQDIELFSSTHGIFGLSANAGQINSQLPSGYVSGIPSNYTAAKQNARVHIALSNPELNPAPANGLVDPSTFRVILHPIPTNYDIDIINVDPTNFASNNGFPWGFIIPSDWQWMTEGVSITKGYPDFVQYADFLLGTATTTPDVYLNWFNVPATGNAAAVLYPQIPWTPFLPVIP